MPASPAGFSFCARCNSSTSQWVIAAKSGTASSNFLTRLKNLNHTFNFSSARATATDASAKTVPSEHRGAHVRALSRIFMCRRWSESVEKSLVCEGAAGSALVGKC